MSGEIVANALVALAVLLCAATIFHSALTRAPRGSKRQPLTYPLVGNSTKQLSLAVVLVVTVLVLGLAYIVREPARLAQATQRQLNQAVDKGAHIYVALCVSCHGLHGEGGIGKPLNVAEFRDGSAQDLDKASESLRKTISRGRYNTSMPAWSQEDGGPLNTEEISHLVALIQYGDWDAVSDLADQAPAQPKPAAGTTGATVDDKQAHQGVPDPAKQGEQVYASKGCAACHGAKLQGGVGPNLQHFSSGSRIVGVLPLDAENLKKWLADPASLKPGTTMPKLGLSTSEVESLIAFLMQQK